MLLLEVLTKHKKAMAWKISDINEISPSFCTHKILMEENSKPIVQPQRRLNPKVQDVIKTEILKLLDARLIYAISDSPWIGLSGYSKFFSTQNDRKRPIFTESSLWQRYRLQPTTADRSRPQPGPQPTKVMTIDKSWTTISNRNSEEFLDGLFAFIKHCKPLLHPITQKIHCPCSRCCNRDDNRVTLEILEVHISRYGFDQHYTTWKYHGEPILPLPPPVPHSPEHVDMDTFFEDISANNVPTPPTQTTGPQPSQTTGPNNEFEELLSRSTQKLYPGCDMSTLEFTTEISHIKALHKITDAGFNKILALLQKACPPSKGYNFPSSYYEIKKTYKKIGLGYESIHACINDCFLFWGSEENLKMPNCPVCKESRYKKKTKAGKLVAKKIVRYFPLTPRLQRMFNTKHIAKWMTWHATGQSKEKGKMNHPCDGRAWKYFDMMKPEFSGDARNVRLGLAADGFNPFGMMSQTYSMWPVILTTYNTPPWMCMKETSLMLTMLIPGPKSPAKDIDVYLQPLIKELQELWKGVWTKDAATGTHFQMKAALLWTINDFPARSSLSGWSGQGYYACPTCNVDTPSMAVKNKIAYVGHRRFLRTQHPERNKFKEYYGSKEPTPKPRKFSELEIQLQISKVLKRRPGKSAGSYRVVAQLPAGAVLRHFQML
ncbi:CACTA transposable element [Tanacetum coccineum]